MRKSNKLIRVSLVLALFFLLSSTLVYAATPRWTKFSGTVTGRTGKRVAAVANATVTLTNSDDGLELCRTTTNTAGYYSISVKLSTATPFSIKVEAAQYRPSVKPNPPGIANPGRNRLTNFILAGDITKPKGTIIINNGAQYTNSTMVNLTLSAQDNANGIVSQMRFSNDKINWLSPEPYSTAKEWTLTGGDGNKFVYAQFMDTAQNWSSVCSDTIILDTLPPQVMGLNITENSKFYENSTVIITPTVSDTDPSPLEYQFSIDSIIKQPWSSSSSFNWITLVQDKGSHNIKVEVKDVGGEDSKQVGVYILRNPIEPPIHQ